MFKATTNWRRLLLVVACAAIAVAIGCQETVIREDTRPSTGLSGIGRPSSIGARDTVRPSMQPGPPERKPASLIDRTGHFLFGWIDDVFD